MAGETNLHKTLKKEACRWLFKMGYRCIAAEVRLAALGIIDAVGTGLFRPYSNYLGQPRETPQVCFVECKASRADFLRDKGEDDQMLFELNRRKSLFMAGRRDRRKPRAMAEVGKFKACLLRPMANLHYVMSPAGLLQKKDLPPRWGLLTLSEHGVNVVVRAEWQESARADFVDSAIARTLTGDIYRADLRALESVNREIFMQQQSLADRIRNIRPHIVLAPMRSESMAGTVNPIPA
jgi:hypothetical protein